MKKLNYRKISLILYAVSLFLPIFSVGYIAGFWAVISYYLIIIIPYYFLPWSANLVYLISIFLERMLAFNPKKSLQIRMLLSFYAIVSGLFAFTLPEALREDERRSIDYIPSAEDIENIENMYHLGVGFYVWFLSFVILFIGHFWDYQKEKLKIQE